MSRYRRSSTSGATYFFTLTTYHRQKILCDTTIRNALRTAVIYTRNKYPFIINAWVLLPDHLHCIWTLPTGDADFSKRWAIIKRKVSIECRHIHKNQKWITPSKVKHRESTIWQRRFWEHQIRDESDYRQHFDYIHWNPVKHGYVQRLSEWPYSTFHQYVRKGVYPKDWGGVVEKVDETGFGE